MQSEMFVHCMRKACFIEEIYLREIRASCFVIPLCKKYNLPNSWWSISLLLSSK